VRRSAAALGAAGRARAEATFAWDAIAGRLDALLARALAGAAPPDAG
jgi:hypothetical protein